jgi:hypothetical protein
MDTDYPADSNNWRPTASASAREVRICFASQPSSLSALQLSISVFQLSEFQHLL